MTMHYSERDLRLLQEKVRASEPALVPPEATPARWGVVLGGIAVAALAIILAVLLTG